MRGEARGQREGERREDFCRTWPSDCYGLFLAATSSYMPSYQYRSLRVHRMQSARRPAPGSLHPCLKSNAISRLGDLFAGGGAKSPEELLGYAYAASRNGGGDGGGSMKAWVGRGGRGGLLGLPALVLVLCLIGLYVTRNSMADLSFLTDPNAGLV